MVGILVLHSSGPTAVGLSPSCHCWKQDVGLDGPLRSRGVGWGAGGGSHEW